MTWVLGNMDIVATVGLLEQTWSRDHASWSQDQVCSNSPTEALRGRYTVFAARTLGNS